MTQPVRLQLSRRKGFDLQAHSQAVNGLPAIKVSRPGIWGNPFVVTEKVRPGVAVGSHFVGYIAVPTAADAVATYGEMLATKTEPGTRAYELRRRLPELRGHNLACWCRAGDPCHADVLLELAAGLSCEAILEPSHDR